MGSQASRLEFGVWGADSAPKHRNEAPRIGKAIPNRNIVLNLHRRHLTASQRGCIAIDVEAQFAAEAKVRQVRKPVDNSVPSILTEQNLPTPVPIVLAPVPEQPPPPAPQVPKPSPPPPKPTTESRDKAAKEMQVANSYISYAEKLKAANRVPRFVPPTCADRVPQSDTPPGRNSVNTKE